MTDWVEQYHQEKQGQDQKGGPGSGHWGHAGRPGMVGGSAAGRMAGRGAVNREYFTKGPGRKMVADLTEAERTNVLQVLTDLKIQPRYLSGLNEVTTDLTSASGCPNWDDCSWAGYWQKSDRSIHMDPEYLNQPMWKNEDKPKGDFWGDTGRNMFAHELGHAITLNSPWMDSAASEILASAYHVKFRKGWSWEYTDMGLRNYSVKNEREFMADCWMVYEYGSEEQKAALVKGLNWKNIESLDDIFGRDVE